MSGAWQLTCVLTRGEGETDAVARSLPAILRQPGLRAVLVDHGGHLPPPVAHPRLTHVAMGRTDRATARNRAVEGLGAGDWVWVLDPGDVVMPHAADSLARALDEARRNAEEPDLVILPGVMADGQPVAGQELLRARSWEWPRDPEQRLFALPDETGLLAPTRAAARLVSPGLRTRLSLRFADGQGGGELQYALAAALGSRRTMRLSVPVYRASPALALSRTDALARLRDAGAALAILGATTARSDPDRRGTALAVLGRALDDACAGLDEAGQAAFAAMRRALLAQLPEQIHWTLGPAQRSLVVRRLGTEVPWVSAALRGWLSESGAGVAGLRADELAGDAMTQTIAIGNEALEALRGVDHDAPVESGKRLVPGVWFDIDGEAAGAGARARTGEGSLLRVTLDAPGPATPRWFTLNIDLGDDDLSGRRLIGLGARLRSMERTLLVRVAVRSFFDEGYEDSNFQDYLIAHEVAARQTTSLWVDQGDALKKPAKWRTLLMFFETESFSLEIGDLAIFLT
ncbi:MAG: hypothetical protein KDK12_14450 [Rhodobacteraceae bacterium]|nr:hypothetical protein [Paracoccaceae bacterium]